MTEEREYLGTRIAVVFNLAVPTVERHATLTRVGNPVLHNHDGTGVYIIGVPDGNDYHWLRTYRAIPGVIAADLVQPMPGQH